MIIVLEWGIVIGSFILSALVCGVVLKVATRLKLLDAPNFRSSHDVVTPHGGGIGIVVAFLLSVSILLFLENVSVSIWVVMVVCGGFIAGIGLWDDISHLAIRRRLLVQFLCIGIGVWLFGGFFAGQIGNPIYDFGFIGFGFAVLLLMWWLNLFNFMDGIDGLAGLEAVFIALSALIVLWLGNWLSVSDLPYQTKIIELLLFLLAASVLGFLVFNWPPAKIFMGDVGSTFLGFSLGMIALLSVIEGVLSLWVWLVLGGVFWVDATVTLLRRMVGGERWYEAHRSHAYQHAAFMLNSPERLEANRTIKRLYGVIHGHTHKSVDVMILIINIFWLLPMACLAVMAPEIEILIFAISWTPLVWMAFRLGAGKRDFI